MKADAAREIGSEFHWVGSPPEPCIRWHEPSAWFALGRGALQGICQKHRSGARGSVLHVPDYFCPEVVKSLRRAGIPLKSYADEPRWPHPHWDSLKPQKGDMVLVVNYFGVRSGRFWDAWLSGKRGVVTIEDHTHDPVSEWALTSRADYAFASLRKTLPIPDGAILWSPRARALPEPQQGGGLLGSALKLTAMVLKKSYLAAQHPDLSLKAIFRRLQVDGEAAMTEATAAGLSPWTRPVLSRGFPKNWRRKREANVWRILKLGAPWTQAKPLFDSWPHGHCPFNPVLLCSSEAARETLRLRLLRADIYATVHWPLNPPVSDHALDLSRRILTIPLDQRYDVADVDRIVSLIKLA